MNNIIETIDLIKKYPVGKGEFTALKDININIERGEFTGLVGPSGSGKTTLLNIIGSLDTPTTGIANVLGNDISKLSAKQSAELRNLNIGYIFQTYNLLPVYTVYENVEFALILQNMPSAQRKVAVMEALEWVGLTDKANSKPAAISGGECQRVAIARAIVKKPELIIADEPTANLDKENSFHILETMKKINKELNTTFVFATHDEKVMKYLDRIISLDDGMQVDDKRFNIK